MTAGLPGAGIGGIFYLASALFMPVRELIAKIADPRAPRRWSLAFRQAGIAGGIMLALGATGWALAQIFQRVPRAHALMGAIPMAAGSNVIKISMLALSLGTLIIVLVLVQIARLVVQRPGDVPMDEVPGQQLLPLPIPTETLATLTEEAKCA
jgi:hypothetical protein